MSLTARARSMIWTCLLVVTGCGFDPFVDGLPAGNPDGHCEVPIEAQAEDVSHPDQVIGNGSPDSCTSDAVTSAISSGGVITFNCGPAPIVIVLEHTAHVGGKLGSRVVIDGGGKVALSGGGKIRILYFDGTDQTLGWAPLDERTLDWPMLSVQNLTLLDGNAELLRPGCGAALYLFAGQLKVVNSRFFRNICNDDHWDGGGGAIRSDGAPPSRPVYVVGSTFGGSSRAGNVGSNGGAISVHATVDVSVMNSVLSHNVARPYIASTGGALDISSPQLNLCGVRMTDNHSDRYAGAIDFSGRGLLRITDSILHSNSSEEDTPGYPGIRFAGQIEVLRSTID